MLISIRFNRLPRRRCYLATQVSRQEAVDIRRMAHSGGSFRIQELVGEVESGLTIWDAEYKAVKRKLPGQ